MMNFDHQKTQNPKQNEWAVVPPTAKPYTAEWFLTNYLSAWDEEDLDTAIRNDIRPDLGPYSELILDNVTELLIRTIKENLPKLKSRIQMRDGKNWMKKIVESAMKLKK